MSTRRRLPWSAAVRRAGGLLTVLLLAALAPMALEPGSALAGRGDGRLTVLVVRDVNGDGKHEPRTEVGVDGIGVEVTDGLGGISHAVTGADGKAAIDLTPLSGGHYRVRTATPLFTKPYLQQTLVSPSAVPNRLAPATSFVDVANGADVTQTVGLWDPDDFVGANARYVTTEQPRGWNGGLSLEPALVSFALGQRDTGGITTEATWSQLGSTYGLAFDRATRTVYVGALAKRHSGYGPAGGGGIYAFDTNTRRLSPFATVPDAAPTAHGTDITEDGTFADVAGKEALGDLEMSPDGRSLFAVGLRAKSLYRFPLDGGAPQVVPIPAPEGISSPEDWRPFALGTGNGKLYVGGVDSAQTSRDPSDLAATVYEVRGATAPLLQVARFTPVLHAPLGGVLRGDVFSNGSANQAVRTHWHPWSPNPRHEPGAVPFDFGTSALVIYPQPELTDIEFDNEGSMILGFRDRTSDQVGYRDGSTATSTMSGGDIVKACGPDDGPWTVEYQSDSPRCASHADPALDGGQQGSPHEFYIGDHLANIHQETGLGGLRVNKSAGDVASTSMDPAGRISTNGVGWYSQVTGQGPGNEPVKQNGLTLVSGDSGFGKGNGLGDLEMIVDQAPVQIGNYVWFDTDRDGVQDANEPPIKGATVRLLAMDGTVLATTTTDAEGEYYFNQSDGLAPATPYRIEFDWSTGTIFGQPVPPLSRYTTPRAQSAGDTVDSDAIVGTEPTVGHTEVRPLRTGQVDHDYDAGINPPVPGYALTKTSDPGPGTPVRPDTPIRYTLTGTNTGQTALNPVRVSDDLSDALDDARLAGGIHLRVLDAAGQVVGERPVALNIDRNGDGTPDGFTVSDIVLQVGQRVVVTYALVPRSGGNGVVGNTASGSAQPPSPVPPGPCCQVTPPPITAPEVHTSNPVAAAPGGSGKGGVAPPGKPGHPAGAPAPNHTKPDGRLAYSGLNVIAPLASAALLVSAGTVTLVITRRRRSGRDA